MIRKPAVAGYFYPDTKEAVESLIDSFDVGEAVRKPAIGVIAPHAGYKYSGPVAARVYSRIEVAGTVVLIGPNHGSGRSPDSPDVAVMSEGAWDLPTGRADINQNLARLILQEAPMVTDAGWAHEQEHSLEVQIPFLQKFHKKVSIVPIIMSRIDDAKLMELAGGVYAGIEKSGKQVTLIASTDFSHYVPDERARELDAMAIEKITRLDAEGLVGVVRDHDISMCGVQPTAVVIDVCKRKGASTAELVSYQTSGDTGGDYSSVVGYGGFLIR